MATALLLAMAVLQGLQLQFRGSLALAQRQQQRLLVGRALSLIGREAARAQRIEVAGLGGTPAACGLAGRRVLLQLLLPGGVITYSLGAPPSPIWRGSVLMRCGPAYGLDGEPSTALPQNRVVLDGLQLQGSTAQWLSAGVVQLTLQGDGVWTQVLPARD